MRIGEFAERIGVSPTTVRAWERRYGILEPVRTPGGQREYTDADLARVEYVQRLRRDGWSMTDAAQRVHAMLGRDGPSDGNGLEQQAAAVWRSIEHLDAAGVHTAVESALVQHPVVTVLDAVFVPVLRRLGDTWRESPRVVAQEHLASTQLRSHLVQLLRATTRSSGPRGIAACPEGEFHDIGLLMAATALAGAGWEILVLGAHTPWVTVETVVRELDPAILLIAGEMRTPAERLLATLRRPREQPTVVLGGRAFSSTATTGIERAVVHDAPFAALSAAVEDALRPSPRA